MQTITLYRANGSWVAKHSDPMVVDLFGTDVLPTAYLAATSPSNVRQAIQKLNPDATVLLAIGQNVEVS